MPQVSPLLCFFSVGAVFIYFMVCIFPSLSSRWWPLCPIIWCGSESAQSTTAAPSDIMVAKTKLASLVGPWPPQSPVPSVTMAPGQVGAQAPLLPPEALLQWAETQPSPHHSPPHWVWRPPHLELQPLARSRWRLKSRHSVPPAAVLRRFPVSFTNTGAFALQQLLVKSSLLWC